tara:strand:- start:329 stop:529 length:201 start_codon:yes stop_codon:yes gene_type:complete
VFTLRVLNHKVLGVPLQFILVISVSILLCVYLAAAAATTAEERRLSIGQDSEYLWEKTVLWACPLH